MTDVFEQLRKVFDGADSFVAGGHEVRGGGSTCHAKRVAATPEWANNDVAVRMLLLKAFPKLDTDENQRKRAAVWSVVLYYYFRMGYTEHRIAIKTKWTVFKIRRIVQKIRWVADGRTVGGKPRKRETVFKSVLLHATYGELKGNHG